MEVKTIKSVLLEGGSIILVAELVSVDRDMETLRTLPLTVDELLEAVNIEGFYLSNCILVGLSECDDCKCHLCEAAAADHDAFIAAGVTPINGRNKAPEARIKSLFTVGSLKSGEYIEINHEGDLRGNIYISKSGGTKSPPDEADT